MLNCLFSLGHQIKSTVKINWLTDKCFFLKIFLKQSLITVYYGQRNWGTIDEFEKYVDVLVLCE